MPIVKNKQIRFPEIPLEQKGLRALMEDQAQGCLESMLVKLEFAEPDFKNQQLLKINMEVIMVLCSYNRGDIDSDEALQQIQQLIDDPNIEVVDKN